ncbi:MAG: site-2 protease family protein [DPANN group archaeon]|nr:site-2 protease family protein [DPANN group archaeon]
MNHELIILGIILATIPAWIFGRHFKSAQNHGPLVLWKTKKGLKYLDKLAAHENFFTVLADLGIIFCLGVFGAYYFYKKKTHSLRRIIAYYVFFLAAGYGIYYIATLNTTGLDLLAALAVGGFALFITYSLVLNTGLIIMSYLLGMAPSPGIAPVIPGVEIPGSPLFVPLVPGVIALIILMVVHEFSHGILARVEKIHVKSLGILSLGIFPIGAFTEPDEAQLKRVDEQRRMRVYAAGSMANFAAMAFFLLLLFGAQSLISDGMQQEYLSTLDYINVTGTAAGLERLAGLQIYNTQDVFSQERVPGKQLTLQTNQGDIQVTRNDQGMIGISSYTAHQFMQPSLGFQVKQGLLEVLLWSFMLNLLVGIVNFLPFFVFDGAKIFEDAVKFYGRTLGTPDGIFAHSATVSMSIFIFILLIINVMPYFVARI